MRRRFLPTILLIGLVGVACARGEITRDEWMKMPPGDRSLVVQSLMGGEDAAAAKGDGGGAYSQTAAFYLAEIDRRYQAGDRRPVNEIWKELRDRK